MRTLYIFLCWLRLLSLEKEVCVERGSLAICPYQGSPLSLALQPSCQHPGVIYRASGGRWLTSNALHAPEFLILLTGEAPDIASDSSAGKNTHLDAQS